MLQQNLTLLENKRRKNISSPPKDELSKREDTTTSESTDYESELSHGSDETVKDLPISVGQIQEYVSVKNKKKAPPEKVHRGVCENKPY